MNKTKLEVIRINEDVIATSGLTVCGHITATGGPDFCTTGSHIKVVNLTVADDTLLYYYPSYSSQQLGDERFVVSGFPSDENSRNYKFTHKGVTELGWYYWNGTTYVKCLNQSDEAHPHQNIE